MLEPWVVIAAICLYVGLLFSIAFWVERRAARGRSTAANPFVYSLSLAVYCTAWTYYGSVGKAATSGMHFLPIYLGPTLCVVLWWIVLRKLVRLKTIHRITSIADFISARYNKSQFLAALATAVAVVGILPYMALQIKAIISSFLLLTATPGTETALCATCPPPASWLSAYLGPLIVGLLIAFTIVLGVRRLDPSERHEGMVTVLAVECVVKLLAFLAAGVFVTYFIYDGFGDLFRKISEPKYQELIKTWGLGSPPYFTWMCYLVLSMSAILFLPRQFHVAVVENRDERHITTAMWLFPLYMFLINIFVLPIAVGGLLQDYPAAAADTFVLLLPLHHGEIWLSLLVFIGGVSAAAGMIMVSSVTIATMIINHLLLPVIEWIPRLGPLKRHLLGCRWAAVAGFIVIGYLLEERIMKPYMLVNIGLISFTAALQFAPAILGGLFWRRGNTAGATWGLGAGFMAWCYTQLIPSFVKNDWLPESLLEKGPLGVEMLKPEALFGLSGLDPISHTVLWTMVVNVGFYVLGSLYVEQSREEESISEQFVGALAEKAGLPRSRAGECYIELSEKTKELKRLLCQYFPLQKASEVLDECLHETGIGGLARISILQLIELHGKVEKVLAGSIGAAAAHRALQEGTVLTLRQSRELSEVYAEILADLKVTPSELKSRIDYYQEREMLLLQHACDLQEKVDELQKEMAARMRVEQALRESEEKFRGLVEAMNEGLEIEDENGFITFVNDKLCEMRGCSRDELIGASAARLFDRWSGRILSRKAATEAGGGAEIACYEATWIAGEGKRISTIVSSVPFLDAEGKYAGSFSVLTDISHIRALEREKANMISMFAHDMRSSLTGIHGLGLRLLTKSSALDEDKRIEYLKIINNEASKLESLVDDFLEFSRLETGRLKLSFGAVSLEKELREIYECYRLRASQRGLGLVLQIEEALPIIEADVARLRRVFTNLLDNALKFSGKTGMVTILAEDTPAYLIVRISDEGCGIGSADLPFIFDLFNRTRSAEKKEGYGIGLATVKAIVEGHGGRVKVESTLGKGSTFSVLLPKERREGEAR